jgi:hypothetical protein
MCPNNFSDEEKEGGLETFSKRSGGGEEC